MNELSEIGKILCEGIGIAIGISVFTIPAHVLIMWITTKITRKRDKKE